MVSTSHAGQRVHIRPGVVIGARAFLPDEEGVIQEEHTHDTGGDVITLVRWANGEVLPMFFYEITEEDHPMLDDSRKGERVQTRTALETAGHKFAKGDRGTVLYEMPNNIGKILVTVNFDGQGQWVVFPYEIEPIPAGGPP